MAKDEDLNTPLHYLCKNMENIRFNNLSIMIEYIIDKIPSIEDLDCADYEGNTPAMILKNNGMISTYNYIISRGASDTSNTEE